MKVVLDTNIFISGIFWLGNPNKIVNAWRDGKIDIIISEETLLELIRVLKEFKIRMPDEMIKEWIEMILRNAILVKPTERISIITEDTSDNKFLECAVAGRANYIISGDKHLLKVDQFKEIKIITPRDFVDSFLKQL